jgi:hypothetical protein
MAFWSWNNTKAPSPPRALSVALRLEPIQVFTKYTRLTGEITPSERRMTDILNTQSMLNIQLPDGDWSTVATEDVLLVAPPPFRGHPQMRVHRRKQRVVAVVGRYEVTGTARAIPGIPLDPYLLRTRQHFLPITEAIIRDTADPTFEQELPVVIVNVGNTTELHSLTLS